MIDEPFSPLAGSCEAVQWELSLALDETRAVSEAAALHATTCPECAHFAGLWQHGATPLPQPVMVADPAFCQRLGDAVAREQIQNVNATPRRWAISRMAVLAAFAAMSWWLLDPRVSKPVARPALAKASGGALTEQMAHLEAPLNREKIALNEAVIGGGAHLHNVLAWSAEAFR